MNFAKVTRAFLRSSIGVPSNITVEAESFSFGTVSQYLDRKFFHLSITNNASHFKARDRAEILKTVPKFDEGLVDPNVPSTASIVTREDMFPDDKTPGTLFNGIPFNQLPICHICVSKNNAKFRINDWENKPIVFRTNGMEGFKKCRRGTNVAAQATALHTGTKAVSKGVRDIRLKIQGLGPGRLAAIKGIQMSGLNIVSITDDTRITWKPTLRPRKIRRV